MSNRTINFLSGFVINRRIGVVLVFAALFLLIGMKVTELQSDFTPQDLFTTYEEERENLEEFKAQFGHTDNVLLVLVEADNVLSHETVAFVHQVSRDFENRPFVDRLESITTVPLMRSAGDGQLDVSPVIEGSTVETEEWTALVEALSDAALIEGRLLSQDRQLTAIALFLTGETSRTAELEEALGQLNSYFELHLPPQGAEVNLAGLPQIRTHVTERFKSEQMRFIPYALAICFLLLFFNFRSLPFVVFSGLTVIVSGALTLGGMAIVGEPINIINQVVPILIMIIAVSDGIHLISRHREELEGGRSPEDAAKRTFVAMAAACFMTSFTTAVGFGSLVVSKTELLYRFGITAAIGVMISYVVTIGLMPPLLSWVGSNYKDKGESRLARWLDVVIVKLVKRVINRPLIALSGSALVFSIGVLLAIQVDIDTRLLEVFEEGDPVWEQTVLVEEKLNGVLPLELSLVSTEQGRFYDPDVLNALDRVARELSLEEAVLSTTSFSDVLHEVWAAYRGESEYRDRAYTSSAEIAQIESLLPDPMQIHDDIMDPSEPYIDVSRQRARMNIQVRDVGARSINSLTERMLVHVAREFEEFEDIEVTLTGDAFVGSTGLSSLVRDMMTSLLTAFLIIFFVMTLLFRSLRLGLLSIPANVIPLVLTMGYMTLSGISLNTATVVTFSISLGLAVDDTIHFLARFNEERKLKQSVDMAIIKSARGAGRAIVVTSLTLLGGMSVLLMSSFMPIQYFSTLLCVTVMSCILGDLILLPAMLKLGWKESVPEN